MGSADPNDLYDAVVTGSVDQRRMSGGEARTHNKDLGKNDNPKPLITYNYSGGQAKRLSVYVGNFSWVSLEVLFNSFSLDNFDIFTSFRNVPSLL